MPSISRSSDAEYAWEVATLFPEQGFWTEAPDRFRQPGVLFIRKENYHLRKNRYWRGVDLVIEVVSADPKDRQHDYRDKLADYAAAQIAEYWIVDPERELVSAYRLEGQTYALHGEFGRGTQATSVLLPGCGVDVTAVFAVRESIAPEE
jgi:Uma2 family endonuclease